MLIKSEFTLTVHDILDCSVDTFLMQRLTFFPGDREDLRFSVAKYIFVEKISEVIYRVTGRAVFTTDTEQVISVYSPFNLSSPKIAEIRKLLDKYVRNELGSHIDDTTNNVFGKIMAELGEINA